MTTIHESRVELVERITETFKGLKKTPSTFLTTADLAWQLKVSTSDLNALLRSERWVMELEHCGVMVQQDRKRGKRRWIYRGRR